MKATRQKGMTLREARKLTEQARLAFTKFTKVIEALAEKPTSNQQI
jgi:hypothetical protein